MRTDFDGMTEKKTVRANMKKEVKRGWKKRLILRGLRVKALIAVLVLTSVCGLVSCRKQDHFERVQIGSIAFCDMMGKTGQALAQIWSEIGVESEAVLIRGSVEGCESMTSGKVNTAILSQATVYGDYKKGGTAIRSGIVLSRRYAQLWTLDPEIRNYMDLEDKIICVGPEGSNGKFYLEAILSALGVKPKQLLFADYENSKSVLLSGRADAFFGLLEAPASFVYRDMTEISAKLIFPTQIQTGMIVGDVPVLRSLPFPNNAYGEEWVNLTTVGESQIYCFREDIPEEVVYSFVKSVFDQHQFLSLHSDEYADFGDDYLGDLIVPLHNGAYRYYIEKGYWVPESAKPKMLKAETR